MILCLQTCAFPAAQATNHACGGRALRCLSDKAAEISSAACRKEVFYFQRMEVRRRGACCPPSFNMVEEPVHHLPHQPAYCPHQTGSHSTGTNTSLHW